MQQDKKGYKEKTSEKYLMFGCVDQLLSCKKNPKTVKCNNKSKQINKNE